MKICWKTVSKNSKKSGSKIFVPDESACWARSNDVLGVFWSWNDCIQTPTGQLSNSYRTKTCAIQKIFGMAVKYRSTLLHFGWSTADALKLLARKKYFRFLLLMFWQWHSLSDRLQLVSAKFQLYQSCKTPKLIIDTFWNRSWNHPVSIPELINFSESIPKESVKTESLSI